MRRRRLNVLLRDKSGRRRIMQPVGLPRRFHWFRESESQICKNYTITELQDLQYVSLAQSNKFMHTSKFSPFFQLACFYIFGTSPLRGKYLCDGDVCLCVCLSVCLSVCNAYAFVNRKSDRGDFGVDRFVSSKSWATSQNQSAHLDRGQDRRQGVSEHLNNSLKTRRILINLISFDSPWLREHFKQ